MFYILKKWVIKGFLNKINPNKLYLNLQDDTFNSENILLFRNIFIENLK